MENLLAKSNTTDYTNTSTNTNTDSMINLKTGKYNATDLEVEAAKELRLTNGDINKASILKRNTVKMFVELVDSKRSKALELKGEERKKAFDDMANFIRNNPHLAIYYESYKQSEDMLKMEKAVKGE